MATYRFEQFKVNITNPSIEVVSVNDHITDKSCDVNIKLTTDSAEFGVNLSGFTYADTWQDADILAWVNTELAKYSV